MVFKGRAPGEAVGSLTQAACPALRQLLVQPGNMLVGRLSSGEVKQAFYSPLATTIACNISTIRDNRREVAFRDTAYIKGFSSRLRTNPTDPVRSESSGGQKVAGSNLLAPTEMPNVGLLLIGQWHGARLEPLGEGSILGGLGARSGYKNGACSG
jgi:hypothetical protein